MAYITDEKLFKSGLKPNKKQLVIWSIGVAIPAVLIILYYIFSSKRQWANAAVAAISRPLRDALGALFSHIPFSVMEIMYTVAGLLLIGFIIKTIVLIVKSKKKLYVALRRVLILLLTAVYIFAAYLWLLGIDYKSDSFTDKSGIEIGGITTSELYTVTKYFIESALSMSDAVERDEDGHFSESIDSIFDSSATIYDSLIQEYSFLDCESRRPKKMILYSKIMSYMGFTGVYFPFTGESNINIDAPRCMIPFTVAHELAHQRGVYAEQEANFLGIAACISSGNPVYAYSGYLSGSLYLLNALYRADRGLWQELHSMISGNMLIDWNDNNAYWDSMESAVTAVSESVYDGYLRANGQELGMASYGACVDLLVTYYLQVAE